MRKHNLIWILVLISLLILSGCIVRTYPVTKDRIDQDLTTGNRGYIKGQAPAIDTSLRKPTRTTQVVEIELHPPIKFEKMPKTRSQEAKPIETIGNQEVAGNRGYITQSEIKETESTTLGLEKYTVEKGDTLQKISQRFYGTTKKWIKIYEANKDMLKSPNEIYPGEVINIPVEPLKETPENLK